MIKEIHVHVNIKVRTTLKSCFVIGQL